MSRSQSSESKQARAARTRRLQKGEEAPPPAIKRAPGQRGQSLRTRTAKEQLAAAFIELGDVAGLVRWGKKNPTEFYRIWARLVPKEENVTVTQVGVEDMLRQLDEQAGAGGDTMTVMNAVGEQLGLPNPESEAGMELAMRLEA